MQTGSQNFYSSERSLEGPCWSGPTQGAHTSHVPLVVLPDQPFPKPQTWLVIIPDHSNSSKMPHWWELQGGAVKICIFKIRTRQHMLHHMYQLLFLSVLMINCRGAHNSQEMQDLAIWRTCSAQRRTRAKANRIGAWSGNPNWRGRSALEPSLHCNAEWQLCK